MKYKSFNGTPLSVMNMKKINFLGARKVVCSYTRRLKSQNHAYVTTAVKVLKE